VTSQIRKMLSLWQTIRATVSLSGALTENFILPIVAQKVYQATQANAG